jgi:hypothetical protein
MTTTEKARIAAEIKAFRNTDILDAPELADEELAQIKTLHLRRVRIDRNILLR